MKTGTKIITLDNGYHLWTNTQGEGDIHLLALHGGPGGNHEYWEDTSWRRILSTEEPITCWLIFRSA